MKTNHGWKERKNRLHVLATKMPKAAAAQQNANNNNNNNNRHHLSSLTIS